MSSPMPETMCHVLLLDLVDDPAAIARYEAWHADGALPPAIGRSIRGAGIAAVEIYRAGTRLVMVMETGPGFDAAAKAAADAADPDVQAWEALMASVQRPVPSAGPGEKWTRAQRIFTLAAQP
jgi:L-rhamnose mutarotase